MKPVRPKREMTPSEILKDGRAVDAAVARATKAAAERARRLMRKAGAAKGTRRRAG